MAPSVTARAHMAFPELRADRPYHQPRDDSCPWWRRISSSGAAPPRRSLPRRGSRSSALSNSAARISPASNGASWPATGRGPRRPRNPTGETSRWWKKRPPDCDIFQMGHAAYKNQQALSARARCCLRAEHLLSDAQARSMRTPTMTRIVARTGRSTLSGTRALRWLPKKMPGREPITSEPSNTPRDRGFEPVSPGSDSALQDNFPAVGENGRAFFRWTFGRRRRLKRSIELLPVKEDHDWEPAKGLINLAHGPMGVV
jgi:hypothetical protein